MVAAKCWTSISTDNLTDRGTVARLDRQWRWVLEQTPTDYFQFFCRVLQDSITPGSCQKSWIRLWKSEVIDVLSRQVSRDGYLQFCKKISFSDFHIAEQRSS